MNGNVPSGWGRSLPHRRLPHADVVATVDVLDAGRRGREVAVPVEVVARLHREVPAVNTSPIFSVLCPPTYFSSILWSRSGAHHAAVLRHDVAERRGAARTPRPTAAPTAGALPTSTPRSRRSPCAGTLAVVGRTRSRVRVQHHAECPRTPAQTASYRGSWYAGASNQRVGIRTPRRPARPRIVDLGDRGVEVVQDRDRSRRRCGGRARARRSRRATGCEPWRRPSRARAHPRAAGET